MKIPALWSLSIPLLLLGAFAATAAPVSDPELGRIDFPNSGAKAAQKPFLTGVLLLHSFEYEDARDAFREAETIDPGFAMAYWGEAMTYNHALWMEVDRKAALEALGRLAPTPEARAAKAPTAREKGFLGAVETLYGEGDKAARDQAYSEAMRRMVEAYPDDLESRAFYALSILGTAEGVRDERIYMRAAAQAEEVYRVNPEHPGALHYLIHSYDDPVHAPLGLRAARAYARVAPAAAHAQHMISHIYVALGYWDETVEANEKSFAVSEDRLRRKGRPIYGRSHHALHWLEYGYLQQGRYRDALRTMGLMDDDAKASGTESNLWYHAMMRAGWLVETGRWKDLPPALPTDGVSLSAAAAGSFTQGWRSLLAGDRPAAEKALAEMRERSRSVAGKTKEAEAGASGLSRNLPSDFHTADVLAKELEGLIAWDAGDKDRSIDLLREAAKLEDAMPYEYGPPVVVKPSHELLGEKLYDLGRYDDAWTQFAASLDRGPRRVLSLLGKARTADRLGRSDDAAETWKTLAEIWKKADPDLPALEEVRKKAPEPKRAAL